MTMLPDKPRRGFLLAISMLLVSAVSVGLGQTAGEPEKEKIVHVIIDYGDGVQKHFTRLAWKPGMTVLEALKAAAKHPRGIQIKYRGRGATAFVTQIDDLENQGRGRNWLYRVNKKLADRGCGAFPLKSGDTVLWRFGEYE